MAGAALCELQSKDFMAGASLCDFVHLDALDLKTSRSHSVLSDACSQMCVLMIVLSCVCSLDLDL